MRSFDLPHLSERNRQFLHFTGIVLFVPIHVLTEMRALQVLALVAFVALFLEWRFANRREQGRIFREVIENLRLLPREAREKILATAQRQAEKERELMDRFMSRAGIREGEEDSPFLPTFTYVLGILFTYIFFGPAIAGLGVVALSTGDAVATIVGTAFGRRRVPYNEGKSFAGSLSFLASAFTALVVLLYFLPSYAVLGYWETAGVVAVVGALAETIPTVDDNFSVPFVVGLVLMLLL